MAIELELRIFKDGYLLNIQTTSSIALNRNYICIAGINKLCEIAGERKEVFMKYLGFTLPHKQGDAVGSFKFLESRISSAKFIRR